MGGLPKELGLPKEWAARAVLWPARQRGLPGPRGSARSPHAEWLCLSLLLPNTGLAALAGALASIILGVTVRSVG